MSYLKKSVDAKGCTAFSEFREALDTEAGLVPPACFSNLVGGNPEQPAKRIGIGGDKVSHCLMPPHTLISQ